MPTTASVSGHLYIGDAYAGTLVASLPLSNSSVLTQLMPSNYQVEALAFDAKKNLYEQYDYQVSQEFAPPYTGSALAMGTTNNETGLAVSPAGVVFQSNSLASTITESTGLAGPVIATIDTNYMPYALALDASQNLYQFGSGGLTIYAPPYTGTPTTTQDLPSNVNVSALAFDAKGDLFVGGSTFNGSSTANGTVYEFAPPYGPNNVIATITNGITVPDGIAVDSAGNVYVTNGGYQSGYLTAYAPPYKAAPFAKLTTYQPGGNVLPTQIDPRSDAIGP